MEGEMQSKMLIQTHSASLEWSTEEKSTNKKTKSRTEDAKLPKSSKYLSQGDEEAPVLSSSCTLSSSYTALPFRSLSEAPVFCTTINWRLVLSPPPNDLWFAAAWIVGIFQEFRTSQINFCNHAVAVLRAASQYKSNPVTTKLWLLTTLDIRIDILTQAG
jgi:hypothetical protein